MALNEDYQTREHLVDALRRIDQALDKGVSVKKLHRFVKAYRKKADIPWQTRRVSETTKGKVLFDAVVDYLCIHRKSTFRELHDKLDVDVAFSMSYLRQLVNQEEEYGVFSLEPLTDRKKIYGHYPLAIYFSEDFEDKMIAEKRIKYLKN